VEIVPRKLVGNLNCFVQAAKFPQDVGRGLLLLVSCPGVCGRSIFKEFILLRDNWVE